MPGPPSSGHRAALELRVGTPCDWCQHMPHGEKETGRTRWVRKRGPLPSEQRAPEVRVGGGNYAARRRAGGSLNRIVAIAVPWWADHAYDRVSLIPTRTDSPIPPPA